MNIGNLDWVPYVFLSAVLLFQVGGSPSHVMMTGTSLHQKGIVLPCWIIIEKNSLLLQREKQTAFSAGFPIALFCLDEAGFSQIIQRTSDCRLREFEVISDSRNRRPALCVYSCSISQIGIDRHRTVRQVGMV